jgi:hypothetical protein
MWIISFKKTLDVNWTSSLEFLLAQSETTQVWRGEAHSERENKAFAIGLVRLYLYSPGLNFNRSGDGASAYPQPWR